MFLIIVCNKQIYISTLLLNINEPYCFICFYSQEFEYHEYITITLNLPENLQNLLLYDVDLVCKRKRVRYFVFMTNYFPKVIPFKFIMFVFIFISIKYRLQNFPRELRWTILPTNTFSIKQDQLMSKLYFNFFCPYVIIS